MILRTGSAQGLFRAPWQSVAIQVTVLIALAVLSRYVRVGDPAIATDEQFYLLVGDRMWHGALPFVDIWDRKPIGLFLLYALFRPLSQDGIVAYQVAAIAFAAGTAILLSRIAMRMTGLAGATVAGAIYLVYLPLVGGAGGQSPVFYNLFTAASALLVVRCIGVPNAPLWRNGLAAMLLAGLAIQVKYTALFEGLAFGGMLLWLKWTARGGIISVLCYAGALVAMALMPTAIAFATYALAGHGDVFASANFLSIFQKHAPPGFSAAHAFLPATALKMAPLLLVSGLATARAFVVRSITPTLAFALVWAVLTVIEFFAIGNLCDHYAIPLLLPLVLIVAAGFEWAPYAFAVPLLTMFCLVLSSGYFLQEHIAIIKARIAAATNVLAPYARQGCIYVYDGPTVLYTTTRSCLPSRFTFPSHLSDADEAGATDAHASMAALLLRRPSAIVTVDRPGMLPRNPDTEAMLAKALKTDYHLVATLANIDDRKQVIYARNDLR